MDYIGLLFEIMFLVMGIYVYLFAIGKILPTDAVARKRSENFRNKNAGWLKIIALLLIAIMLVNISLHIRDMFF